MAYNVLLAFYKYYIPSGQIFTNLFKYYKIIAVPKRNRNFQQCGGIHFLALQKFRLTITKLPIKVVLDLPHKELSFIIILLSYTFVVVHKRNFHLHSVHSMIFPTFE